MNRLLGRNCLALVSAIVISCAALADELNKHYESALQAYAEAEYDDAFIHLRNALQIDPDHLSARLLLAKVYFTAGELYAAEEESEQALLLGADINLVLPIYGTALVLQRKVDKLFELEKAYPSFSAESRFEWALLKGQGYIVRQQPDLAMAEFEKAARMFPSDVRANNTLATIYLGMGKYAQAQALIDKSLMLDSGNEKSWQLNGEIARRQNQLETALAHFTHANELDPDDPKVLRGLARVNLEMGNRAEVHRILELILRQSPDDPAATLLKAMMLTDQDRDTLGAEMLANLSAKLSNLEDENYKKDDSVLFIRATSDYVLGNDESATTLLNSYLDKNRDDLVAIRMLVDLYLKNGRNAEATKLLDSRKAAIANDFGLTLQLIQLHIDQRDTLVAMEMLEDIKRVAAGHPYVILLEAEFLKSRRKYGPALALLNEQTFGAEEPLNYGLLRGELELILKQLPAAQRSAQHLLAQYPGKLGVLNFAAVVYLRSQQWELAQRYIDAALEIDANDVDARFNNAMYFKYQGDFSAARKILSTILREHPEHSSSILLTARILFQQEQYAEAVQWSKKVYAYDRRTTQPEELQYAIYSHTRDWRKAREVALYLTKQEPLNTQYLVDLAVAYIELGNFTVAQRTLYKLYTLWEESAADLQVLAALQLRSENLKGARRSLEAALALDSNSFGIRLDLARLALTAGDSADASARIQVLERETGPLSALELIKGDIALADQRKDIAHARFVRALELNNANSEAIIKLYQLGLSGVGAKKFSAMLESALEENPQPLWVVKILADIQMYQQNWELAVGHYEALLTNPELQNDAEILNNLANIYARNDYEKALVTALRGLSKDGKSNSALLDTIGWIMARQGRHESALPYFREAHSINSTAPEIRFHTAVTLQALGRNVEATQELRSALASEQNFSGRNQALRMLSEMQ